MLECFQRYTGGLDTDVAQAELGDYIADGLECVPIVPTDVGFEFRALLRNLRPKPVVTDEDHARGPDKQVAAVAGEPGEVSDIARLGDKQGVEARSADSAGEIVAAASVEGHAVMRMEGRSIS